MHGHLVLGALADTLDDVDFATVGPIGTCHPEGGPDAAGTTGHVGKVQYHKAVGVACFGSQADRVTSTARCGIGVVDTPAGLIVGSREHGRCGRLVEIVDVTMCGIIELVKYGSEDGLKVTAAKDIVKESITTYSFKVEHVEELVRRVIVLQ